MAYGNKPAAVVASPTGIIAGRGPGPFGASLTFAAPASDAVEFSAILRVCAAAMLRFGVLPFVRAAFTRLAIAELYS